MYYPLLLNMWITIEVTEETLRIFTPFYITQVQCDMILLTPQMAEIQVAAIQV
ncbi:hypothetical protein [Clostridium sp.]